MLKLDPLSQSLHKNGAVKQKFIEDFRGLGELMNKKEEEPKNDKIEEVKQMKLVWV